MNELRPYQLEGIEFLKANPVAGLFMDMGMGKTSAVLHALLGMKGPALLVGPIRVIENVWQQEAAKWPRTRKISFSLIRGAPGARKRALGRDADIYLVNPELLEEALLARSYGVLVIDESSMFKNPSTKRFKTLRKHLAKFERRYILTGTPTPNSLLELWPQIFILDQGSRLETAFFRFRNRYFRQSDWMGYKFEPVRGAEEQVTKLISDIIFRPENTLPPRQTIINPIRFTLPAAAARIYAELEQEAFIILADQEVSAATAATVMMKLRQVASGFVYDDTKTPISIHNEKVKIVEEVIGETGSPVIVVYNFIHELAELRKTFPQGVTLDNGWNQKDWDAGKIPLLFLHPASGGHGLNLQYGSHTMVIFSGSFSYEQMAQTMARIDRQGQEHLVMFHRIIANDTVDELIFDVLEAKASTQTTVLKMVKEYARAKTNRR